MLGVRSGARSGVRLVSGVDDDVGRIVDGGEEECRVGLGDGSGNWGSGRGAVVGGGKGGGVGEWV